MPVTRSVGKKGEPSTATAETSSSGNTTSTESTATGSTATGSTATGSTATGSTATASTATGSTATASTVTATSSAAMRATSTERADQMPTPQVAAVSRPRVEPEVAPLVAADPPAPQAASEHSAPRIEQPGASTASTVRGNVVNTLPRTKALSKSSKKSSKARRIAQARAELAKAALELANARLQAIAAESSDDEDEATVIDSEDGGGRVRTWLQTSHLVDNTEGQPEPEPIAPSEPVPVTTAASWSAPATAPAGVTAALPSVPRPAVLEHLALMPPPPPQPAGRPTPAYEPPAHWRPNYATQPPNSAASWQPNQLAAPPTPMMHMGYGTPQTTQPAIAATPWQPNLCTATPVSSTPNTATTQPSQPAITAASWSPNRYAAPIAPMNTITTSQPLPVNTAASWHPNVSCTPPVYAPLAVPEPPQKKTELQELSAAITQAVQSAHYQSGGKMNELPAFNGAHQDWLTFRAAYYETAHQCSPIVNMSRLRKSLKGAAKEAVQGLLIANADPYNIMKTLETRFGRPDSIATAEMDRLRSLPRLTDSPRELCAFATKVENIAATMQALNCVFYLYNPELSKCIVEKLTPTLKRQWYEFAATQPIQEPDLLKFSRFIRREAEICSPYATPENIPTSTDSTQRPKHKVNTVQQEWQPRCILCEVQGHSITDCSKFKKSSVNERWDIAKKYRLCFRCLRYRKKMHSCKPRRCDVNECTHFHHRLLHNNKTTERPQSSEKTEAQEKVNSAWAPQPTSYLKIASVHISGPAGEVDTFALLDDGSTITLIDEELAQQIGTDGPEESLYISGFDGETAAHKKSRRVTFTARGHGARSQLIQARTIKNLELAAQRIPKEAIGECEHLRDIAGQLRHGSMKPKILIGQDNWHLLLSTDTRTGRRDQLVASLTPLGWVLHGGHTRALGHRVNFLRGSTNDMLDQEVKDYITADNLYIDPRRPNNDPGEKALRTLREHTHRTTEGKYQTALLWKNENVKLPYNYMNTLKRLHNVEKKIDREPELKRRYNEQMEALVTNGYAEPAPPSRNPDRTWYLPHFPVFNPKKPEKLRIVHDAAAKTGGTSLNDQLLIGPDLLQPLPGVLMRFRQHPIAVTADIAEMFMQIELREQDRDALRYLWRGNRRDSEAPEEYRMKSVIFGASSSPATAIYVKDSNAERFIEDYPRAVEAIKKKHYVDDYLDSFMNINDAVQITEEVRKIHRHAHFELKKWASNSPELLQRLGEAASSGAAVDLEDGSKLERVLGLIWRPPDDQLAFNLDLVRFPPAVLNHETPTKREALKIVMSLFDPLGLVSPITIRAKQILQEVWRRGTDWDEQFDSDLAEAWGKWLHHLKNLSQVSVSRCYPGYSTATSLQLHVFVDASESAYATALYWRAITENGVVNVSLITAKARVAPLKLTSIPRLELQAAVLGARMATAVRKEHEQKPEATFYWTDSRTSLTWIRTGSRSYKPYVAHRVAAIEEHSAVNEWRWLPTKLNIADDATRDVPENFNSEHRWFCGPDFLYEEPTSWPQEERSTRNDTGEEKTCIVTSEVGSTNIVECLPDVNRFSKWERYLRATATVLQFIELCRRSKEKVNYKRTRKNKNSDPDWRNNKSKPTPKKNSVIAATTKVLSRPPISAELIRRAENLIIKATQQESFGEEISALMNDRPLPKDSKLHQLTVEYINNELRLKTRIEATTGVPENFKNPLVVHGDHRATRLWIQHVHRRLHHAGVEATVNECRLERWVIRLRPTVKAVIKACVRCRMRTASPPQPATGDLPLCRLAHHQRSFTFVGWDYFGPLTITVGRALQKRYVALFTCLTTRAVHLELAASLSADSAIMALRRMVARRGCPTQLWSDNGTNFHGAERELRDAVSAGLAEEASHQKIDWRFIPPGAPFMGGAWERMVRSVKTALTATLHERHPAEEVLRTLLAEAEHTINSRPLTHVSVSAEDPEALTPNHFLLGGPGRLQSPGEFSERDLNLRASWRASQRLADLFWARWVREYLPELRQRREPHGRGPTLEVDDLVLIVDGNHPRNTWIRGRICATYPGPDGVVRTVDITTQGGVLRRPAKKVVVIPVEKPAPQEDASTSSGGDGDARRERCAGQKDNNSVNSSH